MVCCQVVAMLWNSTACISYEEWPPQCCYCSLLSLDTGRPCTANLISDLLHLVISECRGPLWQRVGWK